MGSSKLKRKKLKNRLVAKERTQQIKQLNRKPVLKNIDVQEIKRSFGSISEEQQEEKQQESSSEEQQTEKSGSE